METVCRFVKMLYKDFDTFISIILVGASGVVTQNMPVPVQIASQDIVSIDIICLFFITHALKEMHVI